MTFAVWDVEWRRALTRRRQFILNMLIPLALVLPIATGPLSAEHAAAFYVELFVAFFVLGSAIPLRWDGERGMSGRVVLGGAPAWSYLVQRAVAGAALDVVQLTPALALVAAVAGASPGDVLVAFGALVATAWVGGLVGVVLAAVSRSLVEAALLGGVSALLLSHMSGVFRMPAPGSSGAVLEGLSPFRALHEALLQITIGGQPAGAGAVVAWGLVLLALVALFGRQLTASLGRTSRAGLEGI